MISIAAKIKRKTKMISKEHINLESEVSILTPIPLPNMLAEVKPFNPDMLPAAIKDFILDVADRQQSPIDFVAVAAICGLAALLGRKAVIYPKQLDDWAVVPNQWGAIIGRPSAMKSPSMKEALKPLVQIETEEGNQFAITMKRYHAEKELD